MNQIACKVAPALVAGCTMVLKPSEIAPLSGTLFAEVFHEAGVPQGVFNLVNGTGPEVGARMSSHPEVDMVSFTGSTRAGIQVAMAAAPTVKRVAQELGGKSPNIILPDADFAAAVAGGVEGCFANSGQSCDAPTRMFVPRARHDEALAIAKATAEAFVTGDPRDEATILGPVVSRVQFDKIQRLIQTGIDEGATLVTGGVGRPAGLNRGYFVRPTVFGDVTNEMTISREEIFGPVLSILPYDSVDHAIQMANDTVYGLAAYIAGPVEDARARRPPAAGRDGQPELSGLGHLCALRRLQAVRQRARICRLGHPRLLRGQGHRRLWCVTSYGRAVSVRSSTLRGRCLAAALGNDRSGGSGDCNCAVARQGVCWGQAGLLVMLNVERRGPYLKQIARRPATQLPLIWFRVTAASLHLAGLLF